MKDLPQVYFLGYADSILWCLMTHRSVCLEVGEGLKGGYPARLMVTLSRFEFANFRLLIKCDSGIAGNTVARGADDPQ